MITSAATHRRMTIYLRCMQTPGSFCNQRTNTNLRRIACAAALAVAMIAGCGSGAQDSLTVSVAASVQNAIREIQADFEHKHPGTRLVFNFGASGALEQQIEQGAP